MIYSNKIEATKITSNWYLWMHHTIDKIPEKQTNKYSWQKNHLENQTGTINKFKPVKIRKNNIKKKNMKLGNNHYFFLLLFLLSTNLCVAENKIVTAPLLNVEKIKPSFEELDKSQKILYQIKILKKKILLTLTHLKLS